MGNIAAADAAFAQVIESKNSGRRREARFQRARAPRQAGDIRRRCVPGRNLRASRGGERLLSLGGRRAGPRSHGPGRLAGGQGRHHPAVGFSARDSRAAGSPRASGLVDRVRRLPNRPAETQARWLVEDGLRLVEIDTGRAVLAFQEAIKIGAPETPPAGPSLQLVRLDLRRAG